MKKENKAKEYAWGLFVAVLGSSILMFIICVSCRNNVERYIWNVVFSSISWIILWLGNSILNSFLDRKISWIKAPMKRLMAGLFGTIVFTIVAAILIIETWQFIWDVSFNDYQEIIINSLLITFFISLFFHGRSFLIQWKQSAVEAERYQKESMVATYENLKSQVNPHFLFNSLNALTSLVYEDQEKAAKFIKQLSEVYRYVLDTRNKELVSIGEELKFLESYSYLQQIRFGKKLSITNSLQGISTRVAPLALQMLIENAVKHNEVSEDKPLHIKLYQEDEYVVVENNLQKRMQLDEASSGLGLDNIVKRYKFLSNKVVGIQQTADQFIVKLPLIPPDGYRDA